MDLENTTYALPLGCYRETIGGPGSAIDNTAFYIRSLIHSGELSAGEQLPREAVLCEHVGVSRVTLRAALKLLQTLGFVVVKRGKNGGCWVVDAETLRARRTELVAANKERYQEMLVFKGIIEREIAGLAAVNRTSEDLELLASLCEFSGGDAAAVHKWYLSLHNALAAAAHNEFLERAMITIRAEMFVSALPPGEQPDFEAQSAAYRGVVEAVCNQDAARAREIMGEYHEFLYQLLWVGKTEQVVRAR